ncbi:Na+/proline symporter [Parageobacillus toebii NBRC 107807]|uniref:Na+/proline symporter n=1 Tax=Parageobacillus toebii NBRC 107807 TaxID=1223503 RepID=A0AA89NUI7_9BACL|nr:Na+/proline symporter [Parageobacillus toebii NBRC 107807]
MIAFSKVVTNISTADSQLLVVTSSISEDIIRNALGMKLTENN